MTATEPSHAEGEDDRLVAELLGRPPLGPYRVVVRRRDGTPAVIENEPFLLDGTPMPTRYWLIDPAVHEAVSRLESRGGVRLAEDELSPDALAALHRRHEEQRRVRIEVDYDGPTPSGGVGGTRHGVKCLHAHLAHHLAGGDDLVGVWVSEQIDFALIVEEDEEGRWLC